MGNYSIKRLNECSIDEIVDVWNRGFEGYFVPIKMTAEAFFQRAVNEGISLDKSIIAFDGDASAGIVLNGFRTVGGKKISWNGGTGVATEYRGKGVSTFLMEEILKIYREENVEMATLEAIKENERAIRLYQKYGYEITDTLVYISGNLELGNGREIQTVNIRPEQLSQYSFYKSSEPWQCQWQSVKQGEAQVYYDTDQNPLGYSIFKRTWKADGGLDKVFLFQVELIGEQIEETIQSVFAAIAGQQDGGLVNYTTINNRESSPVVKYLLSRGFMKTVEQVKMDLVIESQ